MERKSTGKPPSGRGKPVVFNFQLAFVWSWFFVFVPHHPITNTYHSHCLTTIHCVFPSPPPTSSAEVLSLTPQAIQAAMKRLKPQPRRLYNEADDKASSSIESIITTDLMSFEKFYESNRNSFLNATQSEPIRTTSDGASSTNLSQAVRQTTRSNVYDYILSINEDDLPLPLSPYRTGSHFGFNSPRRNAHPLHFHVSSATSQYIPIPRALSIGELFVNDELLECADTNLAAMMQKRVRQGRSRLWLYPRGWQMPQLGYLSQLQAVKEWLTPSQGLAAHNTSSEDSSESDGNKTYDKEELSARSQHGSSICSELMGMEEEEDLGDGIKMEQESDEIALYWTADQDQCPITHCLTPIPEGLDQTTEPTIDETVANEATTISQQLITNIIDTLDLDKENIPAAEQYSVPNIPPFVPRPGNSVSGNKLLGGTFFKKINEMNYSNESPNLEYQSKQFEKQAKIKTIAPQLNSPRRHLMGREERCQRREEFVDIWEEHIMVNGGAPTVERPGTTGSECSDISTFDPLEQRILTQIDANCLDQFDGIFAKIKNSIIESNNSKLNVSLAGVGTPSKVPSSTPTFDDAHSSEMPFGSLNASTIHSSDTIEPAPVELSTSFTQTDEPFFHVNGRDSSTPKTKAKPTLNICRSSNEWALNRSFNKPKLSPEPVAVNVSKTRSHLKTANKLRQQREDTTEDTLMSASVTKQKRHAKHRNFIQENIEKAALKKSYKNLNNNTASSNRVKPKTTPNSTPRSNPSAIFGLSPFKEVNNQSTVARYKNCSANVAECMRMIDPAPIENGGGADHDTSSTGSDPLELNLIKDKIEQLIAGMSSPSPEFEKECAWHDQKSDEMMKCIEECGKRLTDLNIEMVASEMEEIIQLHELTEQERAAEKLKVEEEMKENWVRYNELMFSLSDEDD